MKNFNLNDFYDNLNEAFTEMEMEYVDKEEYRNAGIMLEAQQQLQHEKELNNILNGNNIVFTTYGSKKDHKRFFK
jgi:hypothetical protein|tara:strand:- start:308 stop:532 length:225 start_codon:yes stop_codon:yes gene_type:complete